MINLGIIGTNWITHQFVQAALSTKYELTAVYSRHLEKHRNLVLIMKGISNSQQI